MAQAFQGESLILDRCFMVVRVFAHLTDRIKVFVGTSQRSFPGGHCREMFEIPTGQEGLM